MIEPMRVHPDLLVELRDDHVATIVIDREPDNYIDVEIAAGIADALEHRRVKADEALAIGLCDRLVDGDADALRTAARELALDIAGSAPLAVRAIRRTMRGALATDVRAATDREHAEQQVMRRTDDYKEGLAATAERRTPSFAGH
jgi:enoyl-CoA hydratase/carnithine racemase